MVKDLLSGLRSMRSNLITGVMILITVFLLTTEIHEELIHPEPINRIYSLNDLMEITLIAFLAFFIGSIYTTALEGIINWIHRKRVNSVPPQQTLLKPFSYFLLAIAPFSIASYKRVTAEIKQLYSFHKNHDGYCNDLLSNIDEKTFIKNNLEEILWMEGKLVGTILKETYHQYQSEGESRVSIGLILPITSFAVCSVFSFNMMFTVILLVFISIISLKLVDYGLYYYRRANSFLAHHIADGKLLTSTMEDLLKNCTKKYQKIDDPENAMCCRGI